MDTFFTIYFVVVGGLIILSLILKTLESPKENILVEELVGDVCKWFYKMYPLRKSYPRVVFSNEKSLNNGIYTFHNNTVTLYNKNLKDYEVVINTTVHELTHWYLIRSDKMVREYDEQLEEYKYEFHPQEIWCRAVAAELTNHYIKQKI
jgi:hypothetical protein